MGKSQTAAPSRGVTTKSFQNVDRSSTDSSSEPSGMNSSSKDPGTTGQEDHSFNGQIPVKTPETKADNAEK
jgi:hypothetical protein